VERRLAAILVADVVGFSRLLAADEAGTIAALRQRRAEVLEPVLKEHRGRIVKLMGDGVLVEFASAVNAVAAAIELQKRMAAANEGVPEDRHVVLRVGINLGDVVGAGSDIYGDGVNVAARLEPLAEPGGICVSGKIHQEVLGKTTALFEDMGEQSLKNIAVPVRVYRLRHGVRPSTSPASSSPGLATPVKRDTSKPSIAVLPFDNMSGDPDQEYFSDGITEDIITAISRFRALFVIARNSSFAFRGQHLTIPEIAKRLGVDYVLEGSVRRAGNRVRITAQLIEAASGNHVWSERYDRSLEDIFAVQEEVATVIASTLSGQVRTDIANRATRKHPDSFLVYDYALRGIQLQQKSTRHDADAGRVLLEKAIELDPSYAEAYPWLALCHLAFWGYDLNKAALTTATAIARRGVALDDSSAICHIIVAYCGLYNREFQLSQFHHERACALNPNDAYVATHMGLFLAYTGRAAESSIWFEKGLRLNPFPPTWYAVFAGRAAYLDRRYADAARSFDAPTESVKSLMYLAAALGQLGRIVEARAILDQCARLKPDIPIIKFAEAEPYQNPADTVHLIDGLRKAGLDV
jgi:TolB-like protein